MLSILGSCFIKLFSLLDFKDKRLRNYGDPEQRGKSNFIPT